LTIIQRLISHPSISLNSYEDEVRALEFCPQLILLLFYFDAIKISEIGSGTIIASQALIYAVWLADLYELAKCKQKQISCSK